MTRGKGKPRTNPPRSHYRIISPDGRVVFRAQLLILAIRIASRCKGEVWTGRVTVWRKQ